MGLDDSGWCDQECHVVTKMEAFESDTSAAFVFFQPHEDGSASQPSHLDAEPMSTASVGTEHSALQFGVRNRIVLLTERGAERCDFVRFDKAKRATKRFQYRLWMAENMYTYLCGSCRILDGILIHGSAFTLFVRSHRSVRPTSH